jgi:hypothetical protein
MASPKPKAARHYSAAAQKAASLLKQEKKEIVLSDAQRTAIEAMVFEGKKRKEAAEIAGITDEAMRQALLKPKALAFLNECMEVLRTSARPRALHKMVDLLDAKTERIQFESAKYLDGMDRPSHAVGATQINVQVNNTVSVTPGYVIDLTPDTQDEARQIRHLRQHGPNGLPYQADVPDDE